MTVTQRAVGEERVNVGDAERILSVLAGGALALDALARRRRGWMGEAVLGAGLIGRGVSGDCRVYRALGVSTADHAGSAASLPERTSYHVRRAFTVQRPPRDLYDAWRRLEELPSFMKHLERVEVLGEGRSRWVTRGPAGTEVAWEAEITDDVPGERIAWRSVEGSQIANRGSVRFRPLPHDRGTEVEAEIEYAPPAGALGKGIATLLREDAEVQIRDDLRRFKNLMETGEFPTIDGQTSCRRSEGGDS